MWTHRRKAVWASRVCILRVGLKRTTITPITLKELSKKKKKPWLGTDQRGLIQKECTRSKIYAAGLFFSAGSLQLLTLDETFICQFCRSSNSLGLYRDCSLSVSSEIWLGWHFHHIYCILFKYILYILCRVLNIFEFLLYINLNHSTCVSAPGCEKCSSHWPF